MITDQTKRDLSRQVATLYAALVALVCAAAEAGLTADPAYRAAVAAAKGFQAFVGEAEE